MSPDDPRHGTRRGYYAHRRSGEDACGPCKRGAAAAEARYVLARMRGRQGRIPALGTKRRLHALAALGWTWGQIGAEIGSTRDAVEKCANEPREYVYATTAARVAEVYERLCMTRPEGWIADRTRNAARAKGYAPPLAWDDIDLDDAPVGLVPVAAVGIDPAVVERILAGDYQLAATREERTEVVRRWAASGRPISELARVTGWKPERYYRRRDQEAA